MEPGAQSINPSPEMGGSRPEMSPKKVGEFIGTPESTTQFEASKPQPPQAAPIKPLPQLPSLPVPKPGGLPLVQKPAKNTNPPIANDDDVIEKEWVDKAKQIVSQTRDDPFTQEKEVSKLQADYLKKRYGKELKLSGD